MQTEELFKKIKEVEAHFEDEMYTLRQELFEIQKKERLKEIPVWAYNPATQGVQYAKLKALDFVSITHFAEREDCEKWLTEPSGYIRCGFTKEVRKTRTDGETEMGDILTNKDYMDYLYAHTVKEKVDSILKEKAEYKGGLDLKSGENPVFESNDTPKDKNGVELKVGDCVRGAFTVTKILEFKRDVQGRTCIDYFGDGTLICTDVLEKVEIHPVGTADLIFSLYCCQEYQHRRESQLIEELADAKATINSYATAFLDLSIDDVRRFSLIKKLESMCDWKEGEFYYLFWGGFEVKPSRCSYTAIRNGLEFRFKDWESAQKAIDEMGVPALNLIFFGKEKLND